MVAVRSANMAVCSRSEQRLCDSNCCAGTESTGSLLSAGCGLTDDPEAYNRRGKPALLKMWAGHEGVSYSFARPLSRDDAKVTQIPEPT